MDIFQDLALSGELVKLRRLRLSDLSIFHEYRNDEETSRYQGWSVMSEETALKFLADMIQVKIGEDGKWFQLGISSLVDDSLLGDMGVCIHSSEGWAEVGFTLHPSKRGRGYATDALSTLVEWLFNGMKVERVVSIVDARNTACLSLLKRSEYAEISSEEVTFKGEQGIEYTYEKRRA